MNIGAINLNKQDYENPVHPKIETGKFKDKKVTIIESIKLFFKKIWTAIKQFFVSLYDRCIKKQPKVLPAINHLPKNNAPSNKTNKQWNDVLSISSQPIIQQNPSRLTHQRNPANKNSAPTHQVLRAQTVQQQQYSVSDNVPRAIFIIGGAASGKNGLANEIMGLKPPQRSKRPYRLIDTDQIKKTDPEYQQLAQKIKSHVPANHNTAENKAFDKYVNEKGTDLHWKAVTAKDAQINTTLTQKQHFIHTTTAIDKIFFTGLVDKFKQAGFYVKIYFVDVDLNTCLQRAKKRQDFSGRLIPTKVIKNSNTNSRQLFNQTYRQIAHTARRYENNSRLKMIEKIRNDYSGLSLQPKRN